MSRSDSSDDLITSEQLNSFSVVEYFCPECGKLTPHYIDETPTSSSLSIDDSNVIPPQSLHECVICRENEESFIDDFD